MKILIGYDGSDESKAAVELVKKRALILNAKVYVVTSLLGESHTSTKEIKESEKDLDHVRKLFEENSIPVETDLLVRGLSPGEDLVEFAKENEVNEIVVGVRKTSAVGKLLFGSNARYVILHAHCPVLTVKC
jgi:nucleotide-binding universal stress UspA family protein